LKELEQENAKLKRLVSELSLEKGHFLGKLLSDRTAVHEEKQRSIGLDGKAADRSALINLLVSVRAGS